VHNLRRSKEGALTAAETTARAWHEPCWEARTMDMISTAEVHEPRFGLLGALVVASVLGALPWGLVLWLAL
jgi:hypothetical protein